MKLLLYSLLLLLFVSSSASSTSSADRSGRIFSLFNRVTFKNEPCVGIGEDKIEGACLTETECTDRGGRKVGTCAAGKWFMNKVPGSSSVRS